MSGIIQIIFGFCCLLIAEIGILFGLSYYAINVIAFCYVEPIFTGCMLLFAILSLCKVPIRKIGIIFFWLVVGSIIVLFIIGTVYIIKDCYVYQNNLELLRQHLLIKETDPFIINKFNDTMFWLQDIGYKRNVSYELVNILLYVVAMPVLCITSYIVIRKRKCTVK